MKMIKLSQLQSKIVILLLIVTPLGFGFKLYTGTAAWWFNNYGAGLLYEVFWILLFFLFLPHAKHIKKIVLLVFITTCILEVLQLWHPWLLEQIRTTFIGRTLIGTSFVWWDFPHYVLGCLLGWFILFKLSKNGK